MCGTQWLGPTPVMVTKRLGILNLRVPMFENLNIYGGSAFAVSPALSSFPLSLFSKKKQGSPVAINDMRI
ncbi:hypothetical protein TIFTF001_042230 [Ficus carica]|uniref:Uncharacterized protein n=1 Tax=Ficus carica TaxID=3494 RepID=A0AA87ZXU8_FICCA|nr:hypothetical protein TIFTF001_042230 [Ficus carica]